ncbi:IS5 family transposase [Streptomyces sp. I4(2020)]|nr:IS5 family transposase [Streptomyces sp. I3(2020)]MBJ6628824.1 IS5 family transposase [Streptomyces sp. I4(2020)]
MIEPVLPPWPKHSPGPKPVPDRLCLQGLLFVLYTGIPWQQLPMELGFGSGQTCWRRLERWQAAGVFDKLHRILLSELNAAGELDWSRACVDASHVRAKKGGAATGPSPVDRRKTGGIPLKVITTAANVNDVTQTLALVDGVPPVAGRVGHPRKRPDALLGDKGYDSNPHRKELLRRGILAIISRKGQPDIQSLGKLRYVVEQTFALLHQFKRLAIRWERRLDLHDAFASLACALICWRRLRKR